MGDIVEEYKIAIDNFNGPLDLLLHLIKEKQMDLMHLEIGKICEQYLAYIHQSTQLHLEVASEYLVMASYLIEMKSKMMLPKEKVMIDDTYEEDPREALIAQLLEYKKYKDVVESLKLNSQERAMFHTKLPSDMTFLQQEQVFQMPEHLDSYDLIRAMKKMMERKIRMAPMKNAVAKKEISIEEVTQNIKNKIKAHPHQKIPFEHLFDEGDRTLFVATFLSILVLANQKEIFITQEKQFNQIYVEGLV